MTWALVDFNHSDLAPGHLAEYSSAGRLRPALVPARLTGFDPAIFALTGR